MASSTPTYFQIPKVQQAFISAHRPDDELDLAAALVTLDLDDLSDTDHEGDKSEDPHTSGLSSIMEQPLHSKRVRRSQAAPARERYIPDTPYDSSVAPLAHRLHECDAAR